MSAVAGNDNDTKQTKPIRVITPMNRCSSSYITVVVVVSSSWDDITVEKTSVHYNLETLEDTPTHG